MVRVRASIFTPLSQPAPFRPFTRAKCPGLSQAGASPITLLSDVTPCLSVGNQFTFNTSLIRLPVWFSLRRFFFFNSIASVLPYPVGLSSLSNSVTSLIVTMGPISLESGLGRRSARFGLRVGLCIYTSAIWARLESEVSRHYHCKCDVCLPYFQAKVL